MSNENPNDIPQQDIDDFAFMAESEASVDENQDTVEEKEAELNIQWDPIKEIYPTATLKAELTFPMPMCKLENMDSNENANLAGNEAQRRLWSATVTDFINSGMAGEQAIFNEERMKQGLWEQGLKLSNGVLKRLSFMVSPELKDKTAGLDANEAIYEMDIAEGNASIVNVRCFSIGVAFRLKNCTLLKMSQVFNRIATDKRIIGIETAGAGYSNESTYLDENLTTLIKQCIVQTNIEKFKINMLDEILDDAALDELLLGLATLQYQKGYDFSRPCIKNPDKCTHVDQGVLDLHDCVWVDNNLLSDEQRKLWDRGGMVKLSEVKEYRKQFSYVDEEEFVSDLIRVTYQMPLLKDKNASGVRWLDSIHRSIVDAFGSEPSQNERVVYLNEQMHLSIVGAYVPYIRQLEIFNKDKTTSRIIEDQEAIREALLSRIGTNDALLKKIIKGVLNFQAKNRLTLFGVPKYDCPKCGTPQAQHHGAYGSLIAYSPRVTFMNLGVRRVKAGKS